MTATPLETFISQFVQALHEEQSPQAQAMSQLIHQIFEPAASVICDFVHTVEQSQPTDSPLANLSDLFHSLFECHTGAESSSVQPLSISDELHKAWDFHLS